MKCQVESGHEWLLRKIRSEGLQGKVWERSEGSDESSILLAAERAANGQNAN